MANREALKDLQTRLAARLQAAKVEDMTVASWLAVESGERHFLLPLAQSGEISAWAGVQPIPYTQPWFLGVANLRGTLTGVVDLAGLLAGLSPRAEQALFEASLLTLNSALEVNAALLVDRLVGLRGAQAFIASEPPGGEAAAYWGNTYIDEQGTRWQELNLQALSQHPAFLSIGA